MASSLAHAFKFRIFSNILKDMLRNWLSLFNLFDHKIGEWIISPDYRVTQETQKYLEAWKEEAKSRINLILGDVNEASMTGTGASITTGDSMAYATPNAFKKKNKEV